jgi:hypothetical protein
MPKSGGTVPKQYLRLGLDILAPYAGLPPVGAVEEVFHHSSFSFLPLTTLSSSFFL